MLPLCDLAGCVEWITDVRAAGHSKSAIIGIYVIIFGLGEFDSLRPQRVLLDANCDI